MTLQGSNFQDGERYGDNDFYLVIGEVHVICNGQRKGYGKILLFM